MPRFLEDWDDTPHQAVSFDEPWNGWATPVVTRGALEGLGARWEAARRQGAPVVQLRWDEDGNVALIVDDDPDIGTWRMVPDEDGHYHLAELGFTFWAISDEWNGSEPSQDEEEQS